MATPLMSLPDQSQGKRKYVVPWKSRKEFLKIYEDIYGEDENLQLKAIKRITAWKSRAGSKLSVAVENTGRLFESILHHLAAVKEHQVHEKEDVLRSNYGVAVIRFVNFVTERGQTKATAQPVHILARQFGIPEWIVRIRHDATHNTFPSLDMLATAACWAVQFLKEEFWRYQIQEYRRPHGKKQKLKMSKPVGEIKQALQGFKKLRFEEMKSEDGKKMTTGEVKKLKLCVNENRFGFMSCLLESGAIIPMPHELVRFGAREEDILNQPSPHLPPKLREFWHPVMAMLCSTEEIGLLAKMAAYSLTEEDCFRNHLLAGWLDFILKGMSEDPQDCEKRRPDSLFIDKASIPTQALLNVCLDYTNKFTFHLIKHLLDPEELGHDAYAKLSDLLEVTSSSSSSSLPSSAVSVSRPESDGEEEGQGGGVYSVQDVKEASVCHGDESSLSPIPVMEKVIPVGDASKDEIGWKICTDLVDWSTVPLGVLPSMEVGVGVGADDGDNGGDEEGGGGGGGGDNDDNDDGGGGDDDDHNNDDDDEEEEDDDDDDERHARDWKRSRRKRSFEEEDSGPSVVKRTSPKRSTYTVNDTELL